MTPGGADYRDLYKDKDGVYDFEDHASERSFTLGVHESLIDSIPAVQSNVDMIRRMHRFTGPYTLRKIVRGKPVLPPPPHRLAVGDEVLVGRRAGIGPPAVRRRVETRRRARAARRGPRPTRVQSPAGGWIRRPRAQR